MGGLESAQRRGITNGLDMSNHWIREFQATHHDWLGKPLNVDGVIGPKTRWALDIARLEPWRQEIVARVCSCITANAEPDGANRGPGPDAWNRRSGAALGSPYCASGASWAISVPGLPDVREASGQQLLRVLRRTTMPLPGDVGGAPTGPHSWHVGVVIAQGPGEVAMVEFNHGNRVAVVRRATQGLEFGTNIPILGVPGIPPGLPLVPWSYEGTR
jgi:hypothetical protein